MIGLRCVRDVACQVIAGGLYPGHATIARFRAQHTAQQADKTLPQIEKVLAEAAAAAGTRRSGRRPGDEPRANRAGTDITDPGVRVMRNQKGYVAGYNGQAVVTADQVIGGAMLSRHPAGRTLLHPLLDQCRDQQAAAGIRPELRTVLADSGYVSEENFPRADQDRLRLLAPLGKEPARPGGRPANRTRHLEQYPAAGRAIQRMRRPRGREDCKLRGPHRGTGARPAQDLPETATMSRCGLPAYESEWPSYLRDLLHQVISSQPCRPSVLGSAPHSSFGTATCVRALVAQRAWDRASQSLAQWRRAVLGLACDPLADRALR